jgi:serine/threonine protein phosphatase 1
MAELPKWLRRLAGERPKRPKTPEGTRLYAIGDIHGRRDLLDRLLGLIETDAAQGNGPKTLIFLGDYVDRGPSSNEVVERVSTLDLPGWDLVALRGNHEQILLEFCENSEVYRAWREFGGAETLLSYGVRPPTFDKVEDFERARVEFTALLPATHLHFLRSLSNSHVAGDYFFVHAGVRPGIALDRQVAEDLLWIREDFLLSDLDFEKVIVHGHTPVEKPVIRSGRIGIDTGAYATDCLTAVVLSGETCKFLHTNET